MEILYNSQCFLKLSIDHIKSNGLLWNLWDVANSILKQVFSVGIKLLMLYWPITKYFEFRFIHFGYQFLVTLSFITSFHGLKCYSETHSYTLDNAGKKCRFLDLCSKLELFQPKVTFLFIVMIYQTKSEKLYFASLKRDLWVSNHLIKSFKKWTMFNEKIL